MSIVKTDAFDFFWRPPDPIPIKFANEWKEVCFSTFNFLLQVFEVPILMSVKNCFLLH